MSRAFNTDIHAEEKGWSFRGVSHFVNSVQLGVDILAVSREQLAVYESNQNKCYILKDLYGCSY